MISDPSNISTEQIRIKSLNIAYAHFVAIAMYFISYFLNWYITYNRESFGSVNLTVGFHGNIWILLNHLKPKKQKILLEVMKNILSYIWLNLTWKETGGAISTRKISIICAVVTFLVPVLFYIPRPLYMCTHKSEPLVNHYISHHFTLHAFGLTLTTSHSIGSIANVKGSICGKAFSGNVPSILIRCIYYVYNRIHHS